MTTREDLHRLLDDIPQRDVPAKRKFLRSLVDPIQARYPHFAFSGRWIWLLPSTLMAVLLLNSVLHATLGRSLWELFCPPSDGEQWWAVLLGTCAIVGFSGYALGVRDRSSRGTSE